MMSRTHLTVGMATALSLLSIANPSDLTVVLAGGALGGVLADVDTLDNDYKADAHIGEALAIGAVLMAALLDLIFFRSIRVHITEHRVAAITGGIGLLILWIIGYQTDHRTSTHSLLAMLLFSVFAALVFPRLGVACFLGYASHLLLDILNKKGIQLFYPLHPRICLRLCYASGAANTFFMYAGLVATAILVILRIALFI